MYFFWYAHIPWGLYIYIQELRDEGFGYRAKFIFKTAQTLVNEHGDHADDWLRSLRDVPYEEARAQLLRLPGVC